MARSDKKKKIGIFGGTFNPVHMGHLINVELARDYLGLHTVLLIPARNPVHKDINGIVSPADRLKMTEAAVEGNPALQVSAIEINRTEPSYTVITVNELRAQYPEAELFLMVGADSFNELDTWKSYENILSQVSVVVMRRPGSVELREDLIKKVPLGVFEIENPLIDISSTMIRNRVRQGQTIRYLTQDSVIRYIDQKGLYRN